jgi:hypothetical protein
MPPMKPRTRWLEQFTPQLARAFRLRLALNAKLASHTQAEGAAVTIEHDGRVLRSNIAVKKLLAQIAHIGARFGKYQKTATDRQADPIRRAHASAAARASASVRLTEAY